MLTYEDLMLQFGALVGRRPLILPVPVLTPALSSYWLNLVTAVPTNIARALIDGLEHDVLADDGAIRALIPLDSRPIARRPHGGAARPNEADVSELALDGGIHGVPAEPPDFAFYAKQMSGEACAPRPSTRSGARWLDRWRERLLLSRRAVEGAWLRR